MAPDMGPPIGPDVAVLGEGVPGPVALDLLHDCKIKRKVASGRLRVEALPPEEFLIERHAKALDERTRFCAHFYQATRSHLVEQGYPRAEIEDMASGASTSDYDATDFSRDGTYLGDATQYNGADRSTEMVDVYECYILVDYDGDGIAERRRVVMAGGTSERSILANEEWEDDLPFSDAVPEPVPHRWKGRSLFDEVMDIQRIKTVLWRQTLDNLYMVNNPMTEVVQNQVINMDALINREVGANVFVKAAGQITTLAVEFTAAASFQMLEFCDQVVEKRTGVSRSTMALDMDVLANQTATATNAATAAAATKVETYARNIAELGLRRLFRCVLKLITAHQDRPRTIRLRGKWVEMDPTAWDPDMDVSINTGLGSGSRDRDLAIIGAVTQKQELVLTTLGPDNPIVDLSLYRNTLAKGTEIAGLRQPEQFWKEVTPESMKAWSDAKAQQPDPKMAEAQARMQLDQAKAQHDAQLRQAQAEVDVQHRQQEMQAKAAFDREKAQADLQLARDKAAAELQNMRESNALQMQLAREKAQQEAELKVHELTLEAQLKREQMHLQAKAQAQSDNIRQAAPQ